MRRCSLACFVFFFIALLTAAACNTEEVIAVAEGGTANTEPSVPDEPDAAIDAPTSEGAASCSSKTCSGCCAGGTCERPSAAHCGLEGEACVNCLGSSDGKRCLGGSCGCSSASDCAAGQVCDPVTGRCGASCKTQPCASGCCTPSGTCSTGTATKSCGASGTCKDCSNTQNRVCLPDGACGCNSSSDCSPFSACDLTTHTCTSACSASQPCNGGCCGSGQCRGGTTKTVCGDTGAACSDCTSNPEGTDVCAFTSKGGTCGCQSSEDCPAGQACDPATHTCSTSCSPTTAGPKYCRGGCCDPTTSTCSVGNLASACGNAPAGFVSICKSCAAATEGPSCLGGTRCGCSGPADCPGRTCGTSGRCCDAKGAGCATAATCCSGVCVGFNGVKTCQ